MEIRWDGMLRTAERALDLAKGSGADHVEAFVGENTVTTVRIAGSRVVEVKRICDRGIGLRAAIGQKVGFACANDLSRKLIEMALSACRSKPQDPDFDGFPGPSRPRGVKGVRDRALVTLEPSKVAGLAELMIQSSLDFDRRVKEVSGSLNVVVERCTLSNSQGLAVEDEATRIFGRLTVEAKGVGESEGTSWMGSTRLRGLDPVEIGKRAAELAVNSLNPRKVEPGEYEVVLEPLAVAELFYHVFSYAVNGQDVHDGISYFVGKLGKSVAVEELNVLDWGNMAEGLCSKKFDDEGVPTQRTPLIERGKLVGFVYDRRYAQKANAVSTGNGLRLSSISGRYYGVEPSPYITNLVIEPGDFREEELISDTKEGLLLSRIWYTYPITPQLGDFSTTSRCGFLIRGGEVTGAVRQVRIHENLPKMLKRVTGIANDVKQVMPWGALASVCTPSLRLSGVRIS